MADSDFRPISSPHNQPTAETSHRPRWDAVVALALGVFGLVTAEFLPASLLTPISSDLGLSAGETGQTVTVTAVVAAFAGPGIVIATRNFDRRRVLFGLTALLILSCALAATANNLISLLVSRVLLGVGLGGFWAMAGALAMRLVPIEHLPRAMAMIFTGVSLATVTAAPLGSYVGSTLGWRASFVLAGAVGVLAFIAQAVTVPSLPPAGHAGLSTLGAVLTRPKIRVGLITTLLIVAGHFAGFTYIRPYLEGIAHLKVEMVSLVLLAYGVSGFFGNIVGGMIAELRAGATGLHRLRVPLVRARGGRGPGAAGHRRDGRLHGRADRALRGAHGAAGARDDAPVVPALLVAARVLDHLAVVRQAAGRHQLDGAAQLGHLAHGLRDAHHQAW